MGGAKSTSCAAFRAEEESPPSPCSARVAIEDPTSWQKVWVWALEEGLSVFPRFVKSQRKVEGVPVPGEDIELEGDSVNAETGLLRECGAGVERETTDDPTVETAADATVA